MYTWVYSNRVLHSFLKTDYKQMDRPLIKRHCLKAKESYPGKVQAQQTF